MGVRREWKTVEDFPDYSINRSGRIWSRFTRAFRKDKDNGNGYRYINLSRDGVRYTRSVHRLVVATFLGESDKHVNHINGDKTDNRLENLEYVTASENVQHAHDTGLIRHSRRPVQVTKDGVGHWFPSQTACAKFIKDSVGNVNNLVKGRRQSLKGFTLN